MSRKYSDLRFLENRSVPMRSILITLVTVLLTLAQAPVQLAGQSAAEAAEYNRLLRTYLTVRSALPAAQRAEVEGLFRSLRTGYGLDAAGALSPLSPREPVGALSANPYLPGSTSSFGAKYDPLSPANPYGQFGSPYSTDGARNRYTTGGLEIYGNDGSYLGRLNANQYDPESVANPYGRYGSPYSSQSINNPYGQFGSPYSPYSARNPYGTAPPVLVPPTSSLALPRLPSLQLPPLTTTTRRRGGGG